VTRVKICGITNLEDALAAVDAGADALGFIFVEKTPRFVTPEQVRPIVLSLPLFVTPVGVFWNHPRAHIKAVTETCRLRALQFHGDETPDDLVDYELPVIKTVKLPLPAIAGPAASGDLPFDLMSVMIRLPDSRNADAILLDSAARWSEGEAREPVEWEMAAEIVDRLRSQQRRLPVILSGGLTPDNVARAVRLVKPWAVDVNSGVEARPGKKDPDKVRRFVAEAKRAR
jgi:phosphoribosylanthranilate isomerase